MTSTDTDRAAEARYSLDEIRARLSAVPKYITRPWSSEYDSSGAEINFDPCHQIYDADADLVFVTDAGPSVAALLQNAPEDIEHLLSELEAAQARLDKALEARSRLEIQLEDGELSDGYHTHNELYEYRLLYNAHAARGWVAAGYPVVKSWRHSDGEECFGGGWFVVAAELPTGQVTNHYKADDWGLFEVPEAETAFAWDGHTAAEAADRLRAALGLGEEGTENDR